MVSIKDVARVAGVSDKTVSRVVNREPNVRKDTFDLVERVIAELGYVPNMAARMIRSSRSSTYGIITDFISTTPYSSDIVRGIQDWAGQNDRTVLLANTNGDPEKEREIWKTFQAHRIDGVLYVSMYHRAIEPDRGDVTIPTVLINSHPETKGAYKSIEPDDYQGSADLTRHLIELGHERIGYIRLNPRLLGAELRLAAFLDTTRKAGFSEDQIDVRLGMEGPIGEEQNRVFRVATEMLSQPNRPTALVCGNDEIALQAFLAALSLGLTIPGDICIVGYDDFRTVSLALKPELTTVALPYYDLGFRGADRLNRLLSGETLMSDQLVLPCPLVVRASCGRPHG